MKSCVYGQTKLLGTCTYTGFDQTLLMPIQLLLPDTVLVPWEVKWATDVTARAVRKRKLSSSVA